jgi:glutaminase
MHLGNQHDYSKNTLGRSDDRRLAAFKRSRAVVVLEHVERTRRRRGIQTSTEGCVVDNRLYELSADFLAELIERRFSPDGKGGPVGGIPGTRPNAKQRTLTLLNLPDGDEITARVHADGPEHYQSDRFSQQSMSKASAACYAITLLNPSNPRAGILEFSQQVGNGFSGLPYNKPNFIKGTTIPMNFSDNVGAIKVWDLIVSKTPRGMDPFEGYCRFLGRMTNTTLSAYDFMAMGEFNEGGANMILLNELGIRDQPRRNTVYLSYCRACSVMVTTEDAARIFAVIANKGSAPNGDLIMYPGIASFIFNGLRDHGSYDESRMQYEKTGLYGKTGVGGGIMGQVENHPSWVFAGHHSDLNGYGNSGEVLGWIKDLSRLNLVWPGGETRADARRLPPGVSTRKAIDQQLQDLITPQSLALLRSRIEDIKDTVTERNPNKNGFYLKRKLKAQSIVNGTLLLDAVDRRGTQKWYYYVPDSHFLSKIVVDTDPPTADGSKPRMPGSTWSDVWSA